MPPNKRRKTQLACTLCRARKTGCDGGRPHCTSCVMRGWEDRCSYQDKASASPALVLLELQKRLQKLEENGNSAGRAATRPGLLDGGDSSASTGVVAPTSGISENAQLSTPHAQLQADDDGALYGAFSNSSFVRDVTSAAAGAGSRETGQELLRVLGSSESGRPVPTYLAISSMQSSVRGLAWDMRDLTLPPRNLADSLVTIYWDIIHPVSPLLHRPTFNAQYERLWSPNQPDAAQMTFEDIIFYATFNMMMALGCQRNEAYLVAERESLGDEFYKRSKKLVSIESVDKYSLSLVQMLLLRAIWLLYSPYAERCWTVTSVAVRVAQAIGLDSARLIEQRTSQLTREMRRRIWYCCMMIDRLCSNTFGRPLLLGKERTVPLFAEIDDEYLQANAADKDGQQPHGKPSRLSFFRWTAMLFEISDKATYLQDSHAKTGRYSQYSAVELGTIIEISESIDAFVAELPPHLAEERSPLPSDKTSRDCFTLQRRVLRARIKYVKLWMFRPFLLKEVVRITTLHRSKTDHTKEKATTHYRLAIDVCKVCIQAAHDVLYELCSVLYGVPKTSPWHTLFFAFAAGSVLVAATLCPDLNVRLDEGEGKESWDRTIDLFRFHAQNLPHAERGIEVLEKFRQFISKTLPTSDSDAPLPGLDELDNSMGKTPNTENMSSGSTFVGEMAWTDDGQWTWPFDADPTAIDLSWFTSQDLVFDDWFTNLAA
ncbi:hypothetical protein GQ53DRAFT_86613 [Thozetella sp. PMI_491]|nr:hypothetical protein GQ53DRAFT_86613 [Thozetella sp. PMI_491]